MHNSIMVQYRVSTAGPGQLRFSMPLMPSSLSEEHG